MNKFLRAIFILIILAMLSVAIIQIFLPHLLGEKSAYGLSIHWQRKIGFWNLAILPLLLAVNLKYDRFYLQMPLLTLILGGLGFGTNYLIGYLEQANQANLVGWIENHLLVLLWIIGLSIEMKKRKKSDQETSPD